MAPVQNHFTIIPNAPSAINGDFGEDGSSRPLVAPMTTKQVKKAYQKKTKVPKLSKAEQRRQELFEQDRIRREFEKEKNQARARLARDRKKEKEDKERAEKKKKGLPLVEVHPSQDTISRFLCGKPRKEPSNKVNASPSPNPNPKHKAPGPSNIVVARNAEDSGTDSGTLSAGDEDEVGNEEPPPKKQRIETPPCDPVPTRCSPEVAIEELVQTASNDVATPISNDVAKSQIESAHDVDEMLEQELVCQQLLSESSCIPSSPAKKGEIKEEVKKSQADNAIEGGGVESERMLPKLPEVASSHALENISQPQAVPDQPAMLEKQSWQSTGSSPAPAEVRTMEPKKNVALPTARKALQDLPARDTILRDNITPLKPRLVPTKPTTTPRNSTMSSAKHMFRKPPVPVSASRLSSQPHNGTLMGPPPRPPKFRSPARATGSSVNRPKFVSKVPQVDNHQSLGAANLGQGLSIPPSSTQQFMMSHLDDFFPSPSQEVRELYDEPVASLRTEYSQAMSTSQESMSMSSPSIRQIQPSKVPMLPGASAQVHYTDSKNAAPNPEKQDVTRDSQPSELATHEPCDVQATKCSIDISFLSTQDLVLSQDWMDPKEDMDSSFPMQSYNAGAPVEEPTTSKVEPPLIHEIGVKATPDSLCRKGTDTKGHDRSKHRQISPAPQISRIERDLAKGGDSLESTSISRNAGQPSSKSRDKPKSQGSVGGRSYVSRNDLGESGSAISKSAKNSKHVSQCTNISTSQDKCISRQPSRRDSGALADPTKPRKAAPAPPHYSTKPLFASTNRDFRSKYLIERNKTAVWESSSARRRVQEAVDQFNREEEEAAERLLMEYVSESQESPALTTAPTTTPDPATTTTAGGRPSNSGRPPPPPSRPSDERPKKQTVNQLSSCPPPTTPTLKRNEPTQRPDSIGSGSMQKQQPQHQGAGGQRRPNNSRQPGGSYEEMLALLGQQQLKKTSQPKDAGEGGAAAPAPAPEPAPAPPPPASQETDYGDVELDDELYGFL
ncbi:hypothetical protein SLS62_008482 [Diatrype stigma]|uniref:Uncharacterized protein n=1 Tax=Diatrype stigma TaxID=117547 RepID=A0AAN9YNP7_9PEZI